MEHKKASETLPAKGGSTLNRSIVKVMSLFSSVQMINVLCSIVKMKLVSLWLQAAGVGLFGIFLSVVDTVSTLTDVGLRQSSIREVAAAKNSKGMLARIVGVVRSWNILAGLTGGVAIVLLSPLLAGLIFDDLSQWWSFVVLGLCLFCNSIISGENAILQGLSRFKQIARVSLLSSVTGLLISIPMFRWLGHTSIVLSIVVYSLSGLFFVLRARYKSEVAIRPSRRLLSEGKDFARLGGYMSAAAFVTSLSLTAFVSWLNRYASTEEVGFYQAGSTLVVRYIGFVISAVGMEFYPRLAANIHSRRRHNMFVSHEIGLVLTVLTPLVLIFLAARGLIVEILYSPEFEVIIPFITIGVLHTVFRTVSSIVAFSIIAKGDGKTYLMVEGIDALYGLALCIGMYLWKGLEGIGVAYIIWFMIYFAVVTIVSRCRYGLNIAPNAWMAVGASLAVCSVGALAVSYLPLWGYLPLIVLGAGIYIRMLLRLLRKKRHSGARR